MKKPYFVAIDDDVPVLRAVEPPQKRMGSVRQPTARGDQAALFLVDSHYLAERIGSIPNISVMLNAEVSGVGGGDHLEEMTVHHHDTGETEKLNTAALFEVGGVRQGAVRGVANSVGEGSIVLHFIQQYMSNR